MTPQEIMDLPYYGMAEKQLRKQKKWVLDRDEKVYDLLERAEILADDIQNSSSEILDITAQLEEIT